MRSHDRRPESGREHAQAAPAARTTTAEAARTAVGRSGPLVPEAVAVLQRAAGNAAFSAALAADQQLRHGAGCGHPAPSVQRSPVADVLRTPGRALDDPVRADMESRLGADFSDVRVHTDAAAHESAAAVQAHAYTSGAHIVFQRGRYDGSSAAGRHLLAHELTHVLQQRSGPVAGTDRGDGTRVSDPADRFEREAEANASRVLRRTAPVQRGTEAGPEPSASAGSVLAGHGAQVQRVEAGPLAGQLAEPCADPAVRQRVEAYDALTDQRPKERLHLLGEIADLLHRHGDQEQLPHLRKAVEAEMQRQSARLSRLRRATADEDGPYELMTEEGLLWNSPEFAHGTGALGLTGQSYVAELSYRNLAAMRSENRDRGQKKFFSKERSEPAWMEPVRRKLRQALLGAELHHYTPGKRARAMLTDGAVQPKTKLELEKPEFAHNTTAYDEAGLANTGFVFFVIEAPGAFRGTRFAKDPDDEVDTPACVHLPLQQSGLLSSGWVMLSDFAQREYPEIRSAAHDRADTDSALPTRELKDPATHTRLVRKFALGVGDIEADDFLAVADRPDAERAASSLVIPQVRGDEKSTQNYYDDEGKAVSYQERLFQNILHGPDIIPGLTERAVLEIARFERSNPKLADSLKGMSGEALMHYLLKHLLRPQAMLPKAARIAEENISYDVST
ncbi:eCIS core domain-containing protein [Streptomyces kronopolitis]|uniref:eCIS core domain-containing protein n=1 Tax=Streptomyces kronopolitis TaxID=1612435 RepID=UPI00367D7F82